MLSAICKVQCCDSEAVCGQQGARGYPRLPAHPARTGSSGSAGPEAMRDRSKMSIKGLFFRVDLKRPWCPRNKLAGCPRVSQALQSHTLSWECK